jgi:hypothetical protein
MKRTATIELMGLLGLLLVSAGCAGARARLIAPTCIVPVSYSDSVPTSGGEFYGLANGRLSIIREFRLTFYKTAALFTALPINRRALDVSDDLNEVVQSVGGDAIVHLKTKAELGGWSWIGAIAPLGAVVPGYMRITLTGIVVRVSEPTLPVPAPPTGL